MDFCGNEIRSNHNLHTMKQLFYRLKSQRLTGYLQSQKGKPPNIFADENIMDVP